MKLSLSLPLHLRVGWRSTTERDGRRREAWVECSESQHALLFKLQNFSDSVFDALSAGSRVCVRRDRILTEVTEFLPKGLQKTVDSVKLDGYGEEMFFRAKLYQVADETPWNVQVSEGDVIGLACDLVQGNLRWSLNGDWDTGVSIALDKVSILPESLSDTRGFDCST